MVIERFKQGDPKLVGERFRRQGRMLPEGVTYHASWMDLKGTRGGQLMEASAAELLATWANSWSDLVEFEVVPVATSREYWSRDAG
jgi:Protein of unknown function (DUF3303)